MIMFDPTNVQRTVLSILGALVLSATCVAAAVGPATAGARQSATQPAVA